MNRAPGLSTIRRAEVLRREIHDLSHMMTLLGMCQRCRHGQLPHLCRVCQIRGATR